MSSFTLMFGVMVLALTAARPEPKKAICYMTPDPNSSMSVRGTVKIIQFRPHRPVKVFIHLIGFDPLPAGRDHVRHGFHVHAIGNITGGCGSAGGHFNPKGFRHGNRKDSPMHRHVGDWGNLKRFSDSIDEVIRDPVSTLVESSSNNIIGRAIVLHAGTDDVGRGGNPSSLANGNAGPRLACCVIQPYNDMADDDMNV